jgi:hypothetical protein
MPLPLFVDPMPEDPEDTGVIELRAGDLLEIKMTALPLAKHVVLPDGARTELVLRMEEVLQAEDACALLCPDEPPLPAALPDPLWFPQRNAIVGLEAAADCGWLPDLDLWEEMCDVARHALERGESATLHLISDGSVVGKGHNAHGTYGWLCVGLELQTSHVPSSNIFEKRDGLWLTTAALAGGGACPGPAHEVSSARAELCGLFASIVGALTSGWPGALHCHLDNDSVTRRATALLSLADDGGDLL